MGPTRYRAYLCCGRNCGPKGSAALLDALADEIKRLGLEESVTVLPTGCQSHCESGPTMVIYPGPIYYQAIDLPRLRVIASGHLRDGVPVEEYFWRGAPLRLRLGRGSLLDVPIVDKSILPMRNQDDTRASQKRVNKTRDVDDFKW